MAIPRILKPAILASPSSHFTPSVPSLPFPFKTHSKSLFFTIFPSGIHGHHTPPPTLSRRLFLPSVSGIWDALTSGNNAREAGVAIRRGMLLFRQGDVQGSLVEFDKAIELDPRQKAYLWQRGLSLYYLDRFEEGAEQFRLDVAQNPNDTEESIWCFLCEAQLYGISEARKRFLEKKADAAKLHVLASCQTPYGQRSDDYMASLAKIRSTTREIYAALITLSQCSRAIRSLSSESS
ncbi:uncharacterized protein LOC121263446 isoform X6 [Juglans microcarpa x Juglans regia]|uniref:uncharacterized protein LOC121263446 isoform X6 n=1 Tax=Juglans microcarpa x Juglans regia TaxID=2249226 RepID=UPI001B7E9D06|nr:uncharacterized protein LOC121263446 isoform X6 [Juglans microcarpa x Juglans regia]